MNMGIFCGAMEQDCTTFFLPWKQGFTRYAHLAYVPIDKYRPKWSPIKNDIWRPEPTMSCVSMELRNNHQAIFPLPESPLIQWLVRGTQLSPQPSLEPLFLARIQLTFLVIISNSDAIISSDSNIYRWLLGLP